MDHVAASYTTSIHLVKIIRCLVIPLFIILMVRILVILSFIIIMIRILVIPSFIENFDSIYIVREDL